jgi:hypothetical protein
LNALELPEVGQVRRLDAPDRLLEDHDGDVVRVALGLVVEGISVEGTFVEFGLRGVHRLEGESYLRGADVAVGGGEEVGGRDEGARAVGARLPVEGTHERPDVRVVVSIRLPVGDSQRFPATKQHR